MSADITDLPGATTIDVADEGDAGALMIRGRSATAALHDVIAERQRQIETEGWSDEHDDEHAGGELIQAAACYALGGEKADRADPPGAWPWDAKWWKPTDRRGNLVKACALILAEIERIDRAAKRENLEERGWQWWAGKSEEWMTVGPCASREQAIEEARQQRIGEQNDDAGNLSLRFVVMEARQDPLRLADWLPNDEMLVFADDNLAGSDRVAAECDQGPWFEVSDDLEAELISRIKRTCDEWQDDHGLDFTTCTFSGTRSLEWLTFDLKAASQ